MTTVTTKKDWTLPGRPVHIHKCSDGHEWACSSPYCEILTGECPDHGGPEPIQPGREPWRGR
jgi:hypothetical protein